jgi:hypothetical protein
MNLSKYKLCRWLLGETRLAIGLSMPHWASRPEAVHVGACELLYMISPKPKSHCSPLIFNQPDATVLCTSFTPSTAFLSLRTIALSSANQTY